MKNNLCRWRNQSPSHLAANAPIGKIIGVKNPALWATPDKKNPACVRFLNTLAAAIPEMIVLGVTNADRNRDMIPLPDTAFLPAPGKANDFLQFITEELIPDIRTRYRTTDFRVLYGRSDSGLFALHALMVAPDAFQAVIASSPSLGRCPTFMANGVKKLFQEHPGLAKTLFIISPAPTKAPLSRSASRNSPR